MPPGVLGFRIAKFSSLPGFFYAVPCHVRGSQHGMQLQASCIIVPRVLNFMRRARAHYPQLEVSVQIPRSLTLMACRSRQRDDESRHYSVPILTFAPSVLRLAICCMYIDRDDAHVTPVQADPLVFPKFMFLISCPTTTFVPAGLSKSPRPPTTLKLCTGNFQGDPNAFAVGSARKAMIAFVMLRFRMCSEDGPID
ncbi:hypothetical protein A0H81_07051 [Grifola frondosa]|uniref:Uncharacterized protein n=1 Tax=Grifola frondosa TaxID=5627 RepID=A0A1C7M8G9_GRIFR|nr:hypothetical protein A0H81_07051 [Grifola frondosa]